MATVLVATIMCAAPGAAAQSRPLTDNEPVELHLGNAIFSLPSNVFDSGPTLDGKAELLSVIWPEFEGLSEDTRAEFEQARKADSQVVRILISAATNGEPHLHLWRRLLHMVRQRQFRSDGSESGDWLLFAPTVAERGFTADVHISDGALIEMIMCNAAESVPIPHCSHFGTYDELVLEVTYAAGLKPHAEEIMKGIHRYLDLHRDRAGTQE